MKKLIIYTFMATTLLLISCSSEAPKENNDQVIKSEYRVRPAAEGGTTAAYFNYKNSLNVADTLLSVESAAAEMAQVHETYETDDGMMGMREQKEIFVDAGSEIRFSQGGLHIMLMQLKHNVSEGDSVLVKLQFSQSGWVEVQLPVKSQ